MIFAVVDSIQFVEIADLSGRLSDASESQGNLSRLESELDRLRLDLDEIRRSMKPPLLAIRIDDVQDYYQNNATIFLLQYAADEGIPLNLAIIPKYFGLDQKVVGAVVSAIQNGSMVMVHGWEHEELEQFSEAEQEKRMLDGKNRLLEILGCESTILVPPIYSFNNDTILAMSRTGLTTISTYIDDQDPGLVDHGILSVPATVEMSILVNGSWYTKGLDELYDEVVESIGGYGYAVILTHPEEFVTDGRLDQEKIFTFEVLIDRLQIYYAFTTFDQIEAIVRSS